MERAVAVVAFALLAAAARANGAMGLGLEVWDAGPWFAYVGATVVAEAWLIGRWQQRSWPKSLGLSVLANALTGGLVAFGGLFAAAFHTTLAGTTIDPDPLLHSVALLALFALPSAFVESFFWGWKGEGRLLWRILWVHLAVVPLALAILLVPERPYRGLETTTGWYRTKVLWSSQFRRGLESYIAEHHRVPAGPTPRLLAEQVAGGQGQMARDFETALYRPVLPRFALTDARTEPLPLNTALLGRPVGTDQGGGPPDWVWLVRSDPGIGLPAVVEVDLRSGAVRARADRQRD